MPTRCTATTAAGRPCRAWAVRGTDPPRCTAHRDREAAQEAAGPPAALVAQIDDLDVRIARLGQYIDAHREEWDVGELCRLLDLHSTMMGRATRMRQALRHLGSEEGGALLCALHDALDDIAAREGIDA